MNSNCLITVLFDSTFAHIRGDITSCTYYAISQYRFSSVYETYIDLIAMINLLLLLPLLLSLFNYFYISFYYISLQHIYKYNYIDIKSLQIVQQQLSVIYTYLVYSCYVECFMRERERECRYYFQL